MNAVNVLEQVPIHTDAHGVVRVAGTRVTLETIVDAFAAGATAEEIAQQYPTVPLADVYSVIAYCLGRVSPQARRCHDGAQWAYAILPFVTNAQVDKLGAASKRAGDRGRSASA